MQIYDSNPVIPIDNIITSALPSSSRDLIENALSIYVEELNVPKNGVYTKKLQFEEEMY